MFISGVSALAPALSHREREKNVNQRRERTSPGPLPQGEGEKMPISGANAPVDTDG